MKIELELEVVTPLIMSGADQGEFELREQSINGAMRYWYRKLYGVEGETEIFGSNEKRGKFVLRLSDGSFNVKKVDRDLKIRSGTPNPDMNYGRNYFLGLLRPTRKNNNLDRSAVDSGKFDLFLKCERCSDMEWRKLLGSLWASIYIGGWGTRSRRGFGSLRVSKGDEVFIPKDVKSFYKKAFEEFEFKKILEIYIIESFEQSVFRREVHKTKFYKGRFKRLSQRLESVKIPLSDPMECIDLLGSAMQYFRAYLLPDYDVAKKEATRQKKNLKASEIWRSDFGTPIMFRFRSGDTASVKDRIPSRLFIRVLKISQDFYPVLIFDSSRERVSKEDKSKPIDLLRVFLEILENSGARKVIL